MIGDVKVNRENTKVENHLEDFQRKGNKQRGLNRKYLSQIDGLNLVFKLIWRSLEVDMCQWISQVHITIRRF